MLVRSGAEVILDIADVSDFRHSASKLVQYVQELCQREGVDLKKLAGCVTDNPSVMERVRR